jgi:hypothetical protein
MKPSPKQAVEQATAPTEVRFTREWLQPQTPVGETRKRFRAGKVYAVGSAATNIAPETALAAIEQGAAVAKAGQA